MNELTYTGANDKEMRLFIGSKRIGQNSVPNTSLQIFTPEGVRVVLVGDTVRKDNDGNVYLLPKE